MPSVKDDLPELPKRQCKIAGCGCEISHRRQYCGKHDYRMATYGSPELPVRAKKEVLPLTAESLRLLFDYDPATGIFTYKPRPKTKVRAGTSPQGRMRTGYARMAVNRVMYLAHRLAWLYVYGEWPKHTIDHINGDKADNRIANLRDIPIQMNIQNMRTGRKDSQTGVLGVSPRDDKFISVIKYGGKLRYLGVFDTIEEASAVYLAEKRKNHPGCTI